MFVASIVFALSPGLSAIVAAQESDSIDRTVKSLLGEPLEPVEFSKEQRQKLYDNLDAAKKKFLADPDDVENIIWYGRRTAYLWRYYDAIDIYSKGIEQFPDDPRLYRHRGHRWISVREFDKAIKDLEQARRLIRTVEDQVEPDGQPNAANKPTSTLYTNIFYHLGLAYYLTADFDKAFENFNQCRELAANDDMLVAATDWTYMSLRRAGKHERAGKLLEDIKSEMDIIENFAYHRRLLMYKGELAPEDLLGSDESEEDRALNMATFGYSVGNWYLLNGDEDKAQNTFQTVVQGTYWPAFGYIASEAELARNAKK